MIELQRQLEKLESDIRQSVIDTDEFLFAKLNRAKDELTQKIFFAESRNLKSEIENLETDRTFQLSLRSDLADELTTAAEVVADIHKRLVAAQKAHENIKLRQYFNDTTIEQQRKDLVRLKGKLQSHINKKLQSGENKNAETTI